LSRKEFGEMNERMNELAPDEVVCPGCRHDLVRSEHAWWCPDAPYDGPTPDDSLNLASDAECEGAARDMVYGRGDE
jgi:hypothetical protein